MEITGRLIMVLPLQQGTGKSGTPWQKQEFIIETIEQYPKKICANLWGDKTDALQRLQIGTVVKMSFSLESREFNGKWYTDVRAWKLELADAIPAGYVLNGSRPSVWKPSEVYSPSEISTFPPGPSVTLTSIGATIA